MKATCTWGVGPDVMVELKGTPIILSENPKHPKPPQSNFKHGYVTEGSFDLTAKEAETFADRLKEAAGQAKAYEKDLNTYEQNH